MNATHWTIVIVVALLCWGGNKAYKIHLEHKLELVKEASFERIAFETNKTTQAIAEVSKASCEVARQRLLLEREMVIGKPVCR